MKYLFFVLAVLFFASCEKKSVSSITVKNEIINELKVEYQYDSIKKVKQGYHKTFYPNGKVSIELNYVNDTVSGIGKEFYESGKISGEFMWDKGEYNGDFKYFYENGKLKSEGKYVKDVIKGELKSYYENGVLKEVVMMDENQEKGPFTEYHENGNIKTKGEYAGGSKSEICILEKYDEEGKIEVKMICNGKGVCCTIWSVKNGDTKAKCVEVLKEIKDKCAVN